MRQLINRDIQTLNIVSVNSACYLMTILFRSLGLPSGLELMNSVGQVSITQVSPLSLKFCSDGFISMLLRI